MCNRSLFFLLLLFIVASCAKDVDIFIPDDPDTNPGSERIVSGLTGIILDEQSEPVPNVWVQFGNGSGYSDVNGVFMLSGVEVFPERAVARLEADGYYPVDLVVLPAAGSQHFRTVHLQVRQQNASFSAAAVATVEPVSGLELYADANSLADNNGEVYSGSATVFARSFDPSRLQDLQRLPGDLSGRDQNGSFVTLEAFGALSVELEDATGAPLRIRDDRIIISRTTIPVSLQSNAPTSLSVWRWDSAAGVWEERGIALRDGNEYECEISETGYWMLAVAHPWLEIEGICRDYADRPIGQRPLCLQFAAGNYASWGYTDEQGRYRLRIPANITQDLHLLDDCGDILYTTLLGSLSGNTVLPPIIPDASDAFATWLSGSVTECIEEPLAEGYLFVRQADWTRPVFLAPDGSFAIHLSDCDGSAFQLQAVSLADQEVRSLDLPHVFHPEITLGIINVCADLPISFCNYTLDTENYLQMGCQAESEGGVTAIFDATSQVSVSVVGTVPGLYAVAPGNISLPGFNTDEIVETDLSLLIDSFGNPGESLAGTLSGSFLDNDGTTHTLFMRFRAEVL